MLVHIPLSREISIAYREDHYPLVTRHHLNDREFVCPWNDIEEENPANRSLVVEELKSIDIVLPLVRGNPNRVNSAAENAYYCNRNSHHANASDFRIDTGFGFVVGDDGHSNTHRDQTQPGVARDCFAVKEEI